MQVTKVLSLMRWCLSEGPSYLCHCLFWWIHSAKVLRCKAAACPYPSVRALLLRRSGVRIGRNVEINFGDLVLGRGRTPPPLVLGDRVALGPYVTFLTSSYPNDSVLCEHPEVKDQLKRFRPIEVEDDAWIGAGAIILPGMRIGRCAIVGAGAVVNRDVPPFAVVAGVPARLLRMLSHEEAPRG